jgi:hypothetical protein
MAKGTPGMVTFDELRRADRKAPPEVQGRRRRLITCEHDKLYSGCIGYCRAWIATTTMTSLSTRRGYSLADPRRERYLAEVSIDPAGYVGSLPQFFERDAGINRTVLV